MSAARSSWFPPALRGSLGLALLLHALALGAASVLGFSIVARQDDEYATFALHLAPDVPRPAPEEAFAPAPVEELVPEELVLAETELVPLEVSDSIPEEDWSALLQLEEPAPLAEVDLTPPDLARLDAAFPGLVASADPGSAAGAPGTTAGAASALGVGTGGNAGVTGGAGTGTGPGPVGDGAAVAEEKPRARIREASPLEVPSPAYPMLSRRAGEEGSVLCCLHLSIDGSVTKVDVVESSGHERLDEAARQAHLRWRFAPRTVDGRPIASTLLHRVTFKLDS